MSSVKKTIILKTDDYEKISKLCELEDLSFNAYVNKCIHEYMNRDTDFKFEVLSSIKAINNLIRRMENALKIQRFRMDGQFIWLLPIIISEFEKRTKHEELSDESIANIIKMYEKKVSLFNEYLSKREKSYFSAIEKETAEFLTSN